MSYPDINVNSINVGGVGSIYTNNGMIEISNFNGGGGNTGSTGPRGETGPRGQTGPAGPAGSGSLTIYSNMLNMVSGTADTASRSIPTDPSVLPVFATDLGVETLLDLTPYFNSNTNVITINSSVTLNLASSGGAITQQYVYFNSACWDSINGSGTSLTSTPTLNIATKSTVSTTTDRVIAPINIVLKKNDNFDTSHPYLQIYLSKSANLPGAFLASDTVPVTILSL